MDAILAKDMSEGKDVHFKKEGTEDWALGDTIGDFGCQTEVYSYIFPSTALSISQPYRGGITPLLWRWKAYDQ